MRFVSVCKRLVCCCYNVSQVVLYLLRFQRDIETLFNFQADETHEDDQLHTAWKFIMSTLDLETKVYDLSDIRDSLNRKLQQEGIGESFSSPLPLSLRNFKVPLIFSLCIF